MVPAFHRKRGKFKPAGSGQKLLLGTSRLLKILPEVAITSQMAPNGPETGINHASDQLWRDPTAAHNLVAGILRWNARGEVRCSIC
jgi:hypothetical protein